LAVVRYLPEGTEKNLSKHSLFLGQDMKPEYPKYKIGMVTTTVCILVLFTSYNKYSDVLMAITVLKTHTILTLFQNLKRGKGCFFVKA
jgi:hypothetical protein